MEPEDEALIGLLGDGLTYSEAADALGRSERTVRRRMEDDEFRAAVQQRRAERLAEITGRLGDAAVDAVTVLTAALHDEDSGAQLRSAQLVLNLLLRYRAAADVDARLDAIERRLSDAGSEGQR